jgi:hypothetical protein
MSYRGYWVLINSIICDLNPDLIIGLFRDSIQRHLHFRKPRRAWPPLFDYDYDYSLPMRGLQLFDDGSYV